MLPLNLEELELLIDFRVFILVFITCLCLYNVYCKRDLPPGPTGLPIVGYLPFLSKKPEKQLDNLCKQYGSNIISFRLGSQLAIVLGDYHSIKDAFIKQGSIFSGRPVDSPFKIIKEDVALTTDEGEPWNSHRRLILSTLRDFGMGKTSLEPIIQEEITHCLEKLQDSKGEPMDPLSIFGMSTANIIFALGYGNRFEYSDEKFIEVRSLIDKTSKYLGPLAVALFFPYLKKIPLIRRLLQPEILQKTRYQLKDFNNVFVEEHQKSHIDGNHKDYIDAFLTRRNEIIKQTGDEAHFNLHHLDSNLLALLGAGTDTTTNTLRWALLYMMANPSIQEKVYEEIENVVGNSRYPSINDRSQMPYTEATLTEINRCSSVVALNLAHSNTEETTLGGYRIPKRSYIISNIWAVHHDPDLWDEPDQFKPERFLDRKGNFKSSEYLIPFSVGKRACVGESLAKMVMFLYFSSMIQRFEFKLQDENVDSFDYNVGIIRTPKPFKIRATQRKNYDFS